MMPRNPAAPLTDDLRAWIAAHGWTHAEAAEQLGVAYRTLSGWMAGRGCAHEGMVRRLMALMPPN